MTTNDKHEPETAIDWTGYDAWRKSVASAHQARRHRGEGFAGRHCTVPVEPADGQGITQRSA